MVTVLLALVALALLVVGYAVATGRVVVDGLAPAVTTTPDHGLPARPRATDVNGVRFDTAARGYRMADVDDRLDALRTTLAAREREVEALRDREG